MFVVLLSAIVTELVLGHGPKGSPTLLLVMVASAWRGIWYKTPASKFKRFVGIVVGIFGGAFLWYLMQISMNSGYSWVPLIFMASAFIVAFNVPKWICDR